MAAQLDEADVPPTSCSTYSMAMCAIQFDPTMLPIGSSMLRSTRPCSTETGDIGFERQIGQAKSPERSITYKAVVQHNDNTRELGGVHAEGSAAA